MHLRPPRLLTLLPLLALAALAPTAPAAQRAAPEGLPVSGLPAEDPVTAWVWSLPDEEVRVMDHLEELVDGIGPRLTSSSNLEEAEQWALQRFRDWGLDARLVEWGTFPVGFDRTWKRGRMVAPRKVELDFTTPAWTPGTDGPVRGRAVVLPANDEELAAVHSLLPGAWVLVPGKRPRFDSDGDDFSSRLGRALDEAGIAGTLRPSRNEELVHTGGSYRIDPDDLPHRVRIVLRRDQFSDVLQRVRDGQEVELEFDVRQEFRPGPIALHDVIAEIPGTDLADEIVIVGGHLDSWDGARGAQDNGTGTATTMEAARLLAAAMAETGLRPRRTIRFMLWSGEEQGLLGSRAYIEAHPEENDRVNLVLVHDGGTNACSGITATPMMLPLFEEVFAPIVARTADLEDEDLRFRIVPVDQLPFGVGSDHDSYLAVGVPGFFWKQRGDASYGYIHHTQHDLLDQVVPEYERYTSRVVASAAWRFANAGPRVPREDMGVRGERPPRRRLGVHLGDGLRVDEVVRGGLAEAAGIVPGDRIVEVDGRSVSSVGELVRALRADGDRKRVVWEHGGERRAAWFDWGKGEATPTTAPTKPSPAPPAPGGR